MSRIKKKKLSGFVFCLIILFSIFLRFFELGINPPGLTWDEASLGYNAYSLLKTGADEYGSYFPLSIRSFDDYKPPVYAYLTIPFVAMFGLNELSVRLPSAVIGVFAVVAIYFLVKELLRDWEWKNQEAAALLSSLFLSISPWHLQFSRAAFEGNIGVFFLILGFIFFLKALRNGKFFILSSMFFLLSVYSYHSFRLLVPSILLFLSYFFWKEIISRKRYVIPCFMILVILILPVYLSFFTPKGSGSRLSMVTIFSDPNTLDDSIKRLHYDLFTNDKLGSLIHNRRIVYALATAKGYLDHFNPDFLFFRGDSGVQHHAVQMGMIYLWDLPFILVGIYYLIRRRNRYINSLFLLFLLAPLPSAITTGTPHPVRAIAMIIGLHIFAAVGFFAATTNIYHSKNVIKKIFIPLLIIFTLFGNFIYYLHQYYVHTPVEYGYFWQYGYKDVMDFAKRNEAEYKKIIITYAYDQPYIYYLFYNKIDPTWYQKNWDYNGTGKIDRFERIIGKYEFRKINFSSDIQLQDVLLIGSPDEIPPNVITLREIKFPDGRVAFRIVATR